MIRFLLLLFLWLGFISSSLVSQTTIELRINGEIFLTDQSGVINPEAVISVPAGRLVRIYMVDGTCYKGIITESRISKDSIRIFGRVIGNEDIVFGFGANKGGEFGGALLDKPSNKMYKLEFNETVKGFVFIFSGKINTQIIEI